MIQLYLTRLKCLLKNRGNIFWTFLFPIVLSTLFYMAFSNLYSAEGFHSIDIALVENEDYHYMAELKDALYHATTSNQEEGTKLFIVKESKIEEAKTLLNENRITGYILPGENMQLMVKSSGLNQTIVKSFLESFSQTLNTIQTVGSVQPQSYPALIKDISNSRSYINETTLNNNPPDLTLNYYYALLAMASLFGCFWGLTEIINIQGNLSWKGARINIAPVHKMKLLFCNIIAALTIHFTGILVLLSYLTFVLKLNFGDDFWYIILTCLVASILGISLGTMVTSLSKKNENFKSSVLSAIVMLSSFLAGLMVVQMKYIVATNIPFLQYVNPAHIITDAFYSLYYYETLERFTLNITLMIGYTILFSVITYLAVRRKKYASL